MPYQNNTVINFQPGLSGGDINAFEQQIGEKLAPVLRQHYAQYNGGQLIKRDFTAANGNEFSLHEFLPITPQRSQGLALAFDVARRDPGFMPNDLFPFAVDEGGAYFCIRKTDEHVIFFNSEDADNLDLATVDLAPSLEAFIDIMH